MTRVKLKIRDCNICISKAENCVHTGVVTLGQAFDQTYGALVATRFVIGIFDAGLIPG